MTATPPVPPPHLRCVAPFPLPHSSPFQSKVPATFVEGFHDPAAVAKMQYRPLGSTGCDVSIAGLGGSAFGSVFRDTVEEESINIIVEAFKSGINLSAFVLLCSASTWVGGARGPGGQGRTVVACVWRIGSRAQSNFSASAAVLLTHDTPPSRPGPRLGSWLLLAPSIARVAQHPLGCLQSWALAAFGLRGAAGTLRTNRAATPGMKAALRSFAQPCAAALSVVVLL
jgi:hypothetical protein